MEKVITIKDEIVKKVKAENVRFIKLFFVDLYGALKCVEISAKELDKALENKVMVDGSSILGFAAINNSDAFLVPDLTTFKVLPFCATEKWNVAMLMCDMLGHDGAPADSCTRTNLKRVLSKLDGTDFSNLNVGFEIEFYLFKRKPIGGVLPEDLLDCGGYCENENNDRGAVVRREIMYQLEQMGFSCSTSHHEVGPSQSEVNYLFATALKACDNLVLVKHLIKTIAQKYGYFATFMPKPKEGMAGSGMHTNVSLCLKAGANAFWDAKQKDISDTAKSFIAGILKHARAICFLTNPSVNSYYRLIKHFEAPVNACWSMSNRSAMVRVPRATGNSARAEIRNADLSANPYLAVAGILTAGLDGVLGKAQHIEPVNQNIFGLSEKQKEQLKIDALPTSLDEAMDAFKHDALIKSAVTEKIANELYKHRGREILDYRNDESRFKIDQYLDL